MDFVSVVTTTYNPKTSELRDIPGVPGLQWLLTVYPMGRSAAVPYLGAYIRIIGGSATVGGSLKAIDTNDETNLNTRIFNFYFVNDEERGIDDLLFVPIAGRHAYRVECAAKFTVTQRSAKADLAPLMVHELIDPSKPHCFDATITVGQETIKIHRGFLSMISPVFSAMFGHDTKETKTGIVNITDFTLDTVKHALDYCYGREIEQKTVSNVVDMLRFYDKYDVHQPLKKLEVWLVDTMNVDNFAAIADYAWKCSRESLKVQCGRVFHENVTVLALHREFAELDSWIIKGVIQAGIEASNNIN